MTGFPEPLPAGKLSFLRAFRTRRSLNHPQSIKRPLSLTPSSGPSQFGGCLRGESPLWPQPSPQISSESPQYSAQVASSQPAEGGSRAGLKGMYPTQSGSTGGEMALKKEPWASQELLKGCGLCSLEELRERGHDGRLYKRNRHQFLPALRVRAATPIQKKER